MFRFPCNRIERPSKNQNHNRQETPMIDQQIDIETKDGKTTTFITHPERGGPFPVILFYMDAPGDPRGAARHGAAARNVRLLRDAAQHVLPRRRDGARTDTTRSRGARAQADVRLHELPQHSSGHGRHQIPARLCRNAEGRQHQDRRHRRLLHERPLRRQRGHAFSGSRESRGLGLRGAIGDRPAGQPASGRRARPRPNSTSPVPRPTSMPRRK